MFLVLIFLWLACSDMPGVLGRIPPSQRKFSSPAIEAVISTMTSRLKDPSLAHLFENCFPNCLDTTVASYKVDNNVPDTFVITGDIDATWLRDTTNQVLPYLPYAQQDPKLKSMLCGIIIRQSNDVLHDPFANAFNFGDSGAGHPDDQRKPKMTPHVFEGKYELDSLVAVLKLSYGYYNWTRDTSCFALEGTKWLESVKLIISTVSRMQAGTKEDGASPPYLFQRTTQVATDTLGLQGRGVAARRCGLSKCMFRPSDDSTSLPFLIPANAMTAVELEHVAEILEIPGLPFSDPETAKEARSLAGTIRAAIKRYAVLENSVFGKKIYAYEVDGSGGAVFMDDANIPSLLALPYLGYTTKTDPVYQHTREFLLSDLNPFFFSGTAAEGIGGPHEGEFYIWPMSILMRALTSDDDKEILNCLEMLKSTHAGTFFMHESFFMDDASKFTRPWFAWANSLFGELLLYLCNV
eukprot:TRINITY_DN1007_c0_g1_i2.p1 TRINITY_DN1007_c0_g1~~TRINITY_DN1007_c0_g1_i2.p1  ORF type:complete len:466 (+),score=61.55 TRINITY_DN1007_c0_g1_i2:21-1418(+)